MAKPIPNRLVKRLISAAGEALDAMQLLADRAGDVPEWNKSGIAYRAERKLQRALAAIELNPK